MLTYGLELVVANRLSHQAARMQSWATCCDYGGTKPDRVLKSSSNSLPSYEDLNSWSKDNKIAAICHAGVCQE